MRKTAFTLNRAKAIGDKLGIRWETSDQKQFRTGLGVELEHGTVSPATDVTKDNPLLTGKIALAHLTEFPDLLHAPGKNGREAKRFWDSKK